MIIKFNLNEGRLSQAIKQNPQFEYQLLYYFDESPNKLPTKFIPLIVYLLINKQHNILHIANCLQKFIKYPIFYKKYGFFSDIDILKNIDKFIKLSDNELEQLILQKLNKKKLTESGSKKLFEDEQWILIQILNYIAAFKYSQNTKWCINSSLAKNWFEFYTKDPDRPLFVLINKINNQKYALLLNSLNQPIITNQEDYSIYDLKKLELFNSLSVQLQHKLLKFFE